MRPIRLLIDGPNLTHRMRHAFTELEDQDGIPTGVLYGSLQFLDKMVEMWDPDEILFAWEGVSVTNWRRLIYPDYKSGRRKRVKKKGSDEDWIAFTEYQEPDFKEALGNMGIPQVTIPGIEADDVLGAIVQFREEDDSDYIIISTDKDMLQLVQHERCRVYNPVTDDLYHQDYKTGALICSGKEKHVFAPSPSTWLMWRAITGDTSDSIKGIEGVGDGTVRKLYDGMRWNHDDVKGYLTQVELKGKRGDAIREGSPTINMNLNLMDLSGKGALLYLRKLGASYDDADVFIQQCTGIYKYRGYGWKPPQEWPRFLSKTTLKSPLVRFFGLRNFDFVIEPTSRGDWVAQYRTLYNRRRNMYTKGDVFVVPTSGSNTS